MNETPTPEELVRWLIKLLDVKPGEGDDTFLGRRKRGGVGRVFGGQVIAQALAAAERTVPADREAHSLHAYFLRGGSEDHEIEFAVMRDLDGGSFSNRRVVASQQGRPILSLTASFHRRETGVAHQDAMPQVPAPEDLPNEGELRARFAAGLPEDRRAQMLAPRPIELRPVEKRHWMGGDPAPPLAHTWFRAVAPLPNDQHIHRAVLAYASDMTLLGTCTMPHQVSWSQGNVMGVSLDHAVWFHDDVRADEWLLYATDSTWAGRSRGMNRGRIFARDGRLVASVAQEGLIRVLDKPAR